MAERLSSRGIVCDVVETDASVGGGAFPTARIPSAAIALAGDPRQLDGRLRAADPPVVARIVDEQIVLDARTIRGGGEDELVETVERALA